jgi:hypothetical protein
MKIQRLPPSTCPFCGYVMDSAIAVFDENMIVKPGTLSMCLGCTQFIKFDSELKLIKLRPSELKSLPTKTRDLLFEMRRAAHQIRTECPNET